MSADFTTTPLKCHPTGAVGTSTTPPGTSGGSGNWAEVIASTSVAWLLAGIEINHPLDGNPTFFDHRFIVDVGVGGAGAEAVISSFPGSWVGVGGSSSKLDYVLPILIDAIPAASRVAVRIRRWGDTAPTTAWNIKVLYYEKPITGDVVTTANPTEVYPTGEPKKDMSSGSGAWVNGNYVEIVASTATAVILVGAVIFGSSNGEHNEIDIAIGSAGSESVIATLHYLQSTQPSCPCFFPFATPLDLVPASSRISARNRTDDLSAIVGVSIALLYVEKPL